MPRRAERSELCGKITLHHGLIGRVFLQVVEEAVERHGPEGGAREVEVEAAQAGFVVRGDEMKHGGGPRVRREQQEDERDGDSGPEQKALHYVSPNDGAQAADERVEDGDDTEADDEERDGPTGKSRDGERKQVKDKAHLGKVARGKGEGGIHAHRGAKALAEVFVDRHRHRVAEERHDDGADGEDHEDKENAGHEQIPIARVGRAGEGDEGEAGDDGGQQRKPRGPAGNGAPGNEVGVGGFLAARDTNTNADKRDHVGGNDESVGEMHTSARSQNLSGSGCRAGESELAFSHADGEAHGRLHVGGIGLVAAGDIEGGAVIDGGADDGQAERNIHAAGEVDELHGNVALVVIHGDDEIEFAAQGADKDGVGRVRAGAVKCPARAPPRWRER